MKKIFLSFLLFLSLISFTYAKDLDILSIASNGSLSDKTSHKLNDDELKEVVGGFHLVSDMPFFYNGVTNAFGNRLYFEAYYEVAASNIAESFFINNSTINFGEKVALRGNYDFKSNTMTVTLVAFNKNTKQIRMLNQNHPDVLTINRQLGQLVRNYMNIHKNTLFDKTRL